MNDTKIKIGVLGAYRGSSMINYCKRADNAEIVAVCDKEPTAIEYQKEHAKGLDIAYYDNFEDFIKHDMDAVVLANYAHDHAPFAIRALESGKHVFSEVLPVATIKEAVELVEAVEKSNLVYAYGENYCYMPAPYEMKKLYQSNKIGEFEYGEGEYIHNGESIWHSITYGDKDHWRNNMYSTFYCTHSIGPIIHATKLRPVSVVGIEGANGARGMYMGKKSGSFGMELITLENGGIIKSIHGGLYKNSIWYSMYGSKGRMESERETLGNDQGVKKIFIDYDDFAGDYDNPKYDSYNPTHGMDDKLEGYGHGGSDFYTMWNFVEKIRNNPDADIIDVYEALDMCLPGMFAYRSILDGSVSKEIPNLRDKDTRDKWRNDTACTFKEKAGNMLLPCYSKGEIEIDDGVYENMKKLWDEECKKTEGTYRELAFNQSNKKEK